MEPLARLDSKSILNEDIFLEIFDQEDEIAKARMILSLTDRAQELGVKKKFEELLKNTTDIYISALMNDIKEACERRHIGVQLI